MSNHRSDYLDNIFDPKAFEGTVKRATELAKAMVLRYEADTLAFQGNSGSALGYILGSALGLPLILIRKEQDKSHYWGGTKNDRIFEGHLGARRYIIVDDFYSSGSTVDRIIKSISDNCPTAECVALLMYNQSSRRKIYQCKQEDGLAGKRLVSYSAHFTYWNNDWNAIERMRQDKDSDPEGYDIALRRSEPVQPPTVEAYVSDQILSAKAEAAYNYLRND